MRGTWTLTGRLLDYSTQRPVPGVVLALKADPASPVSDPQSGLVYTELPRLVTDADGYLCRQNAAGRADAVRGVELLVGVRYTLAATLRKPLLPGVTFDAPTQSGAVWDLAEILSGGPFRTLTPDPAHDGYYTPTALIADPDNPGYYFRAGLPADPDHAGYYLIGA